MTIKWKGKGKVRAVSRDEGVGAVDGIVLPLDVVGGGVYDIAYTIPIRVGRNNQNLSVQVDTGSSDLWVASTSCSASPCSQTNGHLYNPASAIDTGQSFAINYLQGNVSGPIVWDKVEIGGYSIDNQALAAGDSVTNEPLSPSFNGILGLALPLNSIIAGLIPPVTSNVADGAAWPSNLFSITPISNAPGARFLSLSLSRPGSNRIPSLLGIGRHPSQVVQDPSQIRYSPLVSERSGTLFWKVSVRAITVYVNGEPRPVELGRSNTGSVFPSAVLDSGVPLILTSSRVANGIYGAIGVSPANDGHYYVPCNTPLNMTITLDDRPELPIHPLDLTAEPPKDNKAQFCIGLIQPADGVLATANSAIGDMILGVPFMRNTYMVMAYTVPNPDGSFPNSITPDGGSQAIKPRLGLLGLTDPTTALDEFKKVRLLNQPLSSNNSSPGGLTTMNNDRKLSVGIIVLIGLLGFFALCFTLFGIRWFLAKRRFTRGARSCGFDDQDKKEYSAYQLERRGSGRSVNGLPSEDTLRTMRFEAYMKKERLTSEYTMSSGQTRVGEGDGDAGDAEIGFRKHLDGYEDHTDDPWDHATSVNWRGNTPAGLPRDNSASDQVAEDLQHDDAPLPERPFHHRTLSETNAQRPSAHRRTLSIATPLLPRHADDVPCDDLAEFGLPTAASMAGVGTAARGGRIDTAFRNSVVSIGSIGSVVGSPQPPTIPFANGRRDRPPAGPRKPSLSSFGHNIAGGSFSS